MSCLDTDQVRVEDLNVQVRQGRADEEILVENRTVLNLIFEVHQNGVLNELRLKETFLINWTVEEALVAQVPEEVHGVVLSEEIL